VAARGNLRGTTHNTQENYNTVLCIITRYNCQTPTRHVRLYSKQAEMQLTYSCSSSFSSSSLAMLCVQIGRWRQQLHITLLRATAKEQHPNKQNIIHWIQHRHSPRVVPPHDNTYSFQVCFSACLIKQIPTQCFDTVGWTTRRASSLWKSPINPHCR